jgi:hypothetical protein
MDAIAEAKVWLNNPSDYNQGLNILKALGANSFLINILSTEDKFNRSTLYAEITKLVEVKVTIPVERTIGNKPFVVSEILKQVDKSALMDERAELKAKLRFLMNDNQKQEERKNIAFDILKITEQLNQLELDEEFFKTYGYQPNDALIVDDDPLSLKKRQATLRTYITRYTKQKSNPDKLQQYQEELAMINAKLEKYAV